jgi:phage terminase large subunit-like protein
LRGRSCYGGLDLSTSVDITAYVLCFPPQTKEDKYKFIYRFFIPEENIVERERKDRVPYRHWIQQGFVIATPGDVIDDVYIEDLIREDAEKYDIKEIAYDPWNANPITNHLTADGMTMVQINQRYASMSPATKDFEKKVLSREIATGGNPVMDWMISCTEVKSDRQGNIMPMKPERDKSGKRIDGVISSIMALNRAVIHTEPEVHVEVYTL